MCSKSVNSYFRTLINNVEACFCSAEHLIEFVELNYTNKGKTAEIFSKKEQIKIGGGDIDPEYIDKVNSNPRECQGAETIDKKRKED